MKDVLRHRRVRNWLALLFLIAAYFAFDPIKAALYRPVTDALGIHMIVHGEMGLLPYATLMVVRLSLDLLLVGGVFTLLGHRFIGLPMVGPRMLRLTTAGLAIGLVVMVGAILAVIASGDATVTVSSQSPVSALLHGAG